MLIGLFNIIGKSLGILDNFTNPNKKEISYKILKQRNIKRALDTAEDIMELIDKHQNELPTTTRNRYIALKRKFNDYD